MELYYTVLDNNRIMLTYATSFDKARDQIELELADEGEFDTDNLNITTFSQLDGTVILDLRDL